MKTISGNKSLVYLKQNNNGANLAGNAGENITLLFKPAYKAVFQYVADKLKGNYVNFVEGIWKSACNIGITEMNKIIQEYLQRHNLTLSFVAIELINKKLRGNIGEIFAELYFTKGKCGFIDFTVYEPIDPMNEDYTDAESIHVNTGLPVNIQIKNFENMTIDRDVFNKCTAMFAQRLYGLKSIINEDHVLEYIRNPHQIIFSFTEISDQRILEDYAGQVIFIGPEEINAAGFQGDIRKNIPGQYRLFENIVKEIDGLN